MVSSLRSWLVLPTLLLAGTTSSCFLVTDLDRFEKPAQSDSNFVDLRLTVRGMTSHVTELFEYRVVDASNIIQSRGFAFPLGKPDATMFIRGAIPKQNGPFHLDFYADHDNSGGYDNNPDQINDHAWRLPLDVNEANDQGAVEIVFDHNTSFSYLADPSPPREIGNAATVRFSGMTEHMGRRVEVRIADASSKRVVALYRVPQVVLDSFSVSVPGMIESGVTYSIEVYTDDGAATPSSIKAYRVEENSTATGLDFPFSLPKLASAQVNDAPPP